MEINEFFDRNMTYREALLETSLTLKWAIDRIHNRVFEITMTGELKEWADKVPVGETHEVSLDVFEGCNDRNVSDMMRLLKIIDVHYEWFVADNNISNEDMEEFQNMKCNMEWTDEGEEDDCETNDDDSPLPF
jgi:hypothetical protein